MKNYIKKGAAYNRELQEELRTKYGNEREKHLGEISDNLLADVEPRLRQEKKSVQEIKMTFTYSIYAAVLGGGMVLLTKGPNPELMYKVVLLATGITIGMIHAGVVALRRKLHSALDGYALSVLANSDRRDERIQDLTIAFRISEKDITEFKNQASLWEIYEHRDGRNPSQTR